MRYRVGLLGIYHESNTFLEGRTSLKDFQNGHLLYGEDIRSEYRAAFHEIGGMLEIADASGLEVVPLVFAEATPGGIITDETLTFLFKEISCALDKHEPFDGILVAVHGAAVSEKHPDMDGWWLTRLRAKVGDIPIIGTLDPHANVSDNMIAATDALVAYKTNPHVDQRAVGQEAARLMAETLRGGIRPVQHFCQPGATISIEQQRTSQSPCRELYSLAQQVGRQPGVLSVSVLLGFPYADVKEMGSGFIVVTDNKPDLASSAARSLADYLWRNKEWFVGKKMSVEEVIATLATHAPPVLLLDMGDNVGGGSPGDSTFLLRALEQQGKWRSFVCVFDPVSVSHAVDAGIGATLVLPMGGKTDALHGQPYRAEVTVRAVVEGVFSETEPRHGGQVNFNMGTTAIVETGNGTTVMLTSRRAVPFSLKQLTTFGIDPKVYDVIVAKGVHAPIAAYAAVCKSFIQVNTEGVTHADMTRLPFARRRSPLYPFEKS